SPALTAEFCNIVRRLWVAVCSEAILVSEDGLGHGLPALGLASDWHMEPVLSSTSDTHSLVWPQTTVEDEATFTVLIPATFMSVVRIGTLVDTVTLCPFFDTVSAVGAPNVLSTL